jgi:hypothetical protein
LVRVAHVKVRVHAAFLNPVRLRLMRAHGVSTALTTLSRRPMAVFSASLAAAPRASGGLIPVRTSRAAGRILAYGTVARIAA